jgi:hypothetical protein
MPNPLLLPLLLTLQAFRLQARTDAKPAGTDDAAGAAPAAAAAAQMAHRCSPQPLQEAGDEHD